MDYPILVVVRYIPPGDPRWEQLIFERHLFAVNRYLNDHHKRIRTCVLAKGTPSSVSRCTDKKRLKHTGYYLRYDSDSESDDDVGQGSGKNATKTAGLEAALELIIGVRYSVTVNIDVSDSLANGQSGIIRHHLPPTSSGIVPCVFLDFDDETIGVRARAAYERTSGPLPNRRWTPIFPQRRGFPREGNQSKVWIERYQLPLRYDMGRTVHRAQGTTETSIIVIDLRGLRATQPGIAYTRLQPCHIM